ncbi:hypothetical protein [Brazilian marseillevirus]|uniref:hypothetical protein n=1 Tax=Brazilian marseillevirus TaxID=1813599 RepID=UPI000784471F|nr:hypothetical protein A3303_gp449 [Brazilian marseillevirus]AMQ10957.1 hypothetical protein [Brazilian marseillevirus]
MAGVVYLVRDDAFWKDGIYKVGKSSDWENRRKSYGKDIRVLEIFEVADIHSAEKEVIETFSKSFKVARGKEFFMCSEKEAILTFYSAKVKILLESKEKKTYSFGKLEGSNEKTQKTRRVYNPKNFGIGCRTCGFATSDDNAFIHHCSGEHDDPGKTRVEMFCASCDFSCNTTIGMVQHIKKKMHSVRMYYVSHIEYFGGNEELAFDMTMKKFGFRNADKTSSHYSARKFAERIREDEAPEEDD